MLAILAKILTCWKSHNNHSLPLAPYTHGSPHADLRHERKFSAVTVNVRYGAGCGHVADGCQKRELTSYRGFGAIEWGGALQGTRTSPIVSLPSFPKSGQFAEYPKWYQIAPPVKRDAEKPHFDVRDIA